MNTGRIRRETGSSEDKEGSFSQAAVNERWAGGRVGGKEGRRPGETPVKEAPERSFETADPRQALS